MVVAGAFSTSGHGFATAHGWGEWRRKLRNACVPTRLGAGGRHTMCLWSYQPPSCRECLSAREAIELYACPGIHTLRPYHAPLHVCALCTALFSVSCIRHCRRALFSPSCVCTVWCTLWTVVCRYAHSTFCLQPPGDVIGRGAIVDAISVGCIPVFFHRAQAALWHWHWNASDASLLFDWADAGGDGRRSNATAVMEALVGLYDTAATRRMQRKVAEVAQRMLYRDRVGGARARPEAREHAREVHGEDVGEDDEDAVDVLVARLGRVAREVRVSART